ncbi:hypothetical protein AMATHDRAFT_6307 [Amanita thiersii Skay4041]|uniref:TECPR1-like DysF domain-containing protein n=1 Tax=Amanita thiersii Skay4041 TaxID=703135 RepID=A0A2A9NA82_9AGAR|nr:hypothetical protein AMATHDRAFT_6307 [Amanita thiersii Skay4041]
MLDFIEVPSCATRLEASGNKATSAPGPSSSPGARRSSLRLAASTATSLPNPSPPPSPTRHRSASTTASGLGFSPSLSLLPQLLLSSSIPGGASLTASSQNASPGSPTASGIAVAAAGGAAAAAATTSEPRRKMSSESMPLLSTKDPLSVPIMSANFRRFVSCVGPVFWLQDRIEEIVMWRKGWRVTGTWMATYAFFCIYPHLILCLPHIVLITVILASYPYPSSTKDSDPSTATTILPDQPPPTEGSVPWQANIQAIQNLMGAVSDLMDASKPYLYHLRLSPAHLYALPSADLSTSTSTASSLSPSTSFSSTSSQNSSSSSPSMNQSTAHLYVKSQRSPYTPHILALLVISLPPLAFVVSLPYFPLRLVVFFSGAFPIICMHPWMLAVFLPALQVISYDIWNREIPEWMDDAVVRARNAGNLSRWLPSFFLKRKHKWKEETGTEEKTAKRRLVPLKAVAQRILDNDKLTDVCWHAEMREVELWENERYVGPPITESTSSSSILSSSPQKSKLAAGKSKGGWSKAHLRQGERGAWTRRRDGWNGFSPDGAGGFDAIEGEVTSTLTFSLAPGWSFVETEDWRKDVTGSWAADECGGGDEDGWVYSNDLWLDPQSTPLELSHTTSEEGAEKPKVRDQGSGGPYVTRRRRWIRRVWYDPSRAGVDA